MPTDGSKGQSRQRRRTRKGLRLPGKETANVIHTQRRHMEEANANRMLQMVGAYEDITARKHAEEALRASEEQLRATVRELATKNAELERFTYSISHDLRSPLVTIQCFLDVLREDLAKGRHELMLADMKRIASAVEKMEQRLNDLLDLSRVGRTVDLPSDVPLDLVVCEALDCLAGPAANRGAEIVVHPDLPVVRGDRHRLVAVFQNLIENALKYSGNQAHPRIEIGARHRGQDTLFFVKDNGMGVDPRYQETIFGLFNQLDPNSEGTGLGLALSRRIIEVHGGRMWVESDGVGQGSTFLFTLPRGGFPARKP